MAYMTSKAKMKQAGKLVAVISGLCFLHNVHAQPTGTSPVAMPPPTPAVAAHSSDAESSITVQQIVARQEEDLNKIRNAQGTAVHAETRYHENGQAQPPTTQYLFFAYEGDRSVTLTMPQQAAQIYKSNQGQIPWKSVLSAFHVTGDAVYTIRQPEASASTTSTLPRVFAMPFNPAVHENNPLVRFHPRQISDEQMPLRDLARAIPGMVERPKVYDIVRDGKPFLKVDFANSKTPGDRLIYIIDPSRGYLPVEITHIRNSKPISKSQIIIGNTPGGNWIPARRERLTYNAAGKLASRQSWHYDYLAVNQNLAPKTLSLMYFNLSPATPVTVVNGDSTSSATLAAKAPANAPAATARPRTTPAPTRQAPEPIRVPLR